MAYHFWLHHHAFISHSVSLVFCVNSHSQKGPSFERFTHFNAGTAFRCRALSISRSIFKDWFPTESALKSAQEESKEALS